MSAIRVILADDNDILRRSLTAQLSADDDIEVIDSVGDGEELLAACRRESPDVAVVDIRMPRVDGIEASSLLRKSFPDVKILILTTFDDDEYIQRLFRVGIDGYVLKGSAADRYTSAIKSIHMGVNTLDQQILQKISRMLNPGPAEKPVSLTLTFTEEKVARLISEGNCNKDIANALGLSYGRVRNIVSDIYRKLGADSRQELVGYYENERH